MKFVSLIGLIAAVNAINVPIQNKEGTPKALSGARSFKQTPNLKALEKLKKYVSIDTSHPIPGAAKTDADYTKSTEFLINYAKELGMSHTTFECLPGKTLVTLKLAGKDPSLPGVILNSHIDVVAADPKDWKYPPFSPTEDKDVDGDDILYGRGTQDTKAIAIAYMEAIRNLQLKDKSFQPERNLYVNFSPEEEVGGMEGLGCFVKSDAFKKLNIGFVIDEGILGGEDYVWDAVYSERARWAFTAIANGNTGHASMFIKNLATDKVEKFHEHVKQFRAEQEAKANPENTWDGKVTSVNLNLISGGIAINVVPPQVNYTYDMRVSPLQNHDELKQTVLNWAKDADVTIDFIATEKSATTENLPENLFFKRLQAVAKSEFGAEIRPMLLPAVTDARFYRELGIPAIGFNPYRHMPSLEHRENEYIKLDIFYEAIKFYESAIPQLTKL